MVGNGNLVEGEDLIVGHGAGGEGGDVLSGLGLDCYADHDDGMMREDEEDLGSKKKKMKRHNNCDPMSSVSDGGGHLSTEGKILAFLGSYITQQKEREREEREYLREAAEREREQSRLERERIREEQEPRREREREDREWERDLVNRDRWEEEKQKERAWEEKREEEKQEWRERMTALQLGHQATIAQNNAGSDDAKSTECGISASGCFPTRKSSRRNSGAKKLFGFADFTQFATATGCWWSVSIRR